MTQHESSEDDSGLRAWRTDGNPPGYEQPVATGPQLAMAQPHRAGAPQGFQWWQDAPSPGSGFRVSATQSDSRTGKSDQIRGAGDTQITFYHVQFTSAGHPWISAVWLSERRAMIRSPKVFKTEHPVLFLSVSLTPPRAWVVGRAAISTASALMPCPPPTDGIGLPRQAFYYPRRTAVISEIITVGLDLEKNLSQAHRAEASGCTVVCKKLRRAHCEAADHDLSQNGNLPTLKY